MPASASWGKGHSCAGRDKSTRECVISQWGLIAWVAKEVVAKSRVPMTWSEAAATLRYTVRAEELYYKNKHSAYEGRAIGCRVTRTLLRGHTIFELGKGVDPVVHGRLIRVSGKEGLTTPRRRLHDERD